MGKKAKPRVLWIYHEYERVRRLEGDPKSACTTCNSETFERWEGCTSGRKLKSSIKNCTGREIRVYTWENTRHKSTFQRKLTNVHLLTSFRLDLRCALDFCLSICFQMFRCRNCFSKLRKYFAFEQFNM